MAERIRIAVDAMGGDYAPHEVVKGAVEAAREFTIEIVLVGQDLRMSSTVLQRLRLAGLVSGFTVNILSFYMPVTVIFIISTTPTVMCRRSMGTCMNLSLIWREMVSVFLDRPS